MRAFLPVLFLSLLPVLGFSQPLDYADAPKVFMGYTMGSAYTDVVSGLDTNTIKYTTQTIQGTGTMKLVTVQNQTLETEKKVLVRLLFSNDSLCMVSATLDYRPDLLKTFLDKYTAQFGAVKSNDGGYTFPWFYFGKNHTLGEVPDFAVTIAGDPVTSLKIVITYSDNVIKLSKPAV